MSLQPTLSGPADANRFVEVNGERIVLLGTEAGPFELWMWPLILFRDAVIQVEDQDAAGRSVTVEPGALHRVTPTGTSRSGRGRVQETLVASPTERALVWLVSLEGPRALEVELSLCPDFRPQWPAGLGGRIAGRDEDTGAYLLTEELGRYAALLGGAGFEVAADRADRVREGATVRFRARLEPGRPLAFVVAGAEREPQPLSEAARLGLGQAATGLSRAGAVVEDARRLWRTTCASWPAEHERARRRWTQFLMRTTKLASTDRRLERAFRWSQIAIERAWARVDGLGRGLVAGLAESRGGDRPGYGWFFDGDALVAARAQTLAGDRAGPPEVLRFAAAHQRADGKLMHELVLSAGLCDWLGDYPYAYYKGINSADFAITLDRWVRAAGDRELARALSEPLSRAIEWCASTCDEEGRPSVRAAGIAAVEAGPLSDRIESEVFLTGAWIGALASAERVASAIEDGELAARARALRERAEGGFEAFWSEERGRYGFARLADGSLLADLTAYVAYPLALGAGRPERRARTLPFLNHPSLAADWGPRMFATDAAVYDPDHYNTGAVFPYLANFAILALWRGGLAMHAAQLYRAQLALWSRNGRGLVEEHLPGDRCRTPARGVPHQIFSSSTIVESLLAGHLGLEPDGLAHELAIEPRLPLVAPHLRLERVAVGAATVALDLREERAEGRTVLHVRLEPLEGGPPALRAALCLPPGSTVASVRDASGRAVDSETLPGPGGTVRVRALESQRELAFDVRLGPFLAFPQPTLAEGGASREPRIVGTAATDAGVTWELFGPAGTEHAIPLRADVAVAAEETPDKEGGVELEGPVLRVHFPESDANPGAHGFTRREVRLRIGSGEGTTAP